MLYGLFCIIFLININVISSQSILQQTSYSIKEPSYLIVAPRVIRPAEKIRITATILRKDWPNILVKALIYTNEQEIASGIEEFLPNVQGAIVMQVSFCCHILALK